MPTSDYISFSIGEISIFDTSRPSMVPPNSSKYLININTLDS
jgi:hypothetical protein